MILEIWMHQTSHMTRIVIFSITIGSLFAVACGNNNSADKKDDGISSADSQKNATYVNSDANFPKTNIVDPSADNANKTALSDTSFVAKSIDGNRAEIRLCELALARTANAEIKKIANHLKTDHTAFLNQLDKMKEGNKNVSDTGSGYLPTEVQTTIKNLTDTSVDAFDAAWVAIMVKKHDKTIDDYEVAMRQNKDKSVQSFIGSALPKIKAHAKELEQFNRNAGKK
jgi:putative membrane protein